MDNNTKPSGAPATIAEKTPKYVGPQYRNGLIMPDGKQYDPKSFSATERLEFLKRYPAKASWWK